MRTLFSIAFFSVSCLSFAATMYAVNSDIGTEKKICHIAEKPVANHYGISCEEVSQYHLEFVKSVKKVTLSKIANAEYRGAIDLKYFEGIEELHVDMITTFVDLTALKNSKVIKKVTYSSPKFETPELMEIERKIKSRKDKAFYSFNNCRNEVADGCRELNQKCENGVGIACFLNAYVYYSGEGKTQDQKEAKRYIRKACENGFDVGCLGNTELTEEEMNQYLQSLRQTI